MNTILTLVNYAENLTITGFQNISIKLTMKIY